MTTTTPPKHPARYSKSVMTQFRDTLLNIVADEGPIHILDPFAGTGRIHELAVSSLIHTTGVELEPEWAAMHPWTRQGNALELTTMFPGHFHAVVTSPTYGNRLADHHNAQDGSVRRSYTHDLGRPLHPDNSGQMAFGKEYQDFHRKVWDQVYTVLRPNGWFILNVSDFIRGGEVVPVVKWHLDALHNRFKVVEDLAIDTPRLKFGQNASARVSHERIIVMRKDR